MDDPIHQFEIVKYITLGHWGRHEIAFTNSALFMAIALAAITIRRAMNVGSSPAATIEAHQYRAASGSLPRMDLMKALTAS